MSTATDRSTRLPRRDALRPLRYLLRVPLLLILAVLGVLIALLGLNPLTARIRVGSSTLDQSLVRWWSRGLLRLFGFRVRRIGTPLTEGVLYVANHISWLDIELMHSQRAMGFVAKSEIAGWPLVGWMAQRSGTIFHRRGNTDSLTSVMNEVTERLRRGDGVGVFPEGGTGRGGSVRTFHARIFQTALDAGVPVQPVALLYGRDGQQDPGVPFASGEKFFPNLWRLLGGAGMDAEVHFLQPVEATPEARRRMAEESRARIMQALGYVES